MTTFTPLSCTRCHKLSFLREVELLRLPHTVLFRCAHCRTVAVVVDRSRSRSTDHGGGARAA